MVRGWVKMINKVLEVKELEVEGFEEDPFV